MNRLAILAGAVAVAGLFGAGGYAVGSLTSHGPGMNMGMGISRMMNSTHMPEQMQEHIGMMRSMMEGMKNLPLNGDPSHDFAAMMIPHHQAAVEMAQALLRDDRADEGLKTMAREIIEAQTREIGVLETYLQKQP